MHARPARVDRLIELAQEFPAGAKFLLYAFDGCYRSDGSFDAQRSVLRVPNDYVMRIAQREPARFEWAASVNPARPDAADMIRHAVRNGACALKWVPYLMDIDPAAVRLNAFYDLLAELKLPLVVHAGWQHPLLAQGNQDLGNPLRLRRALERGVSVVVAHCATQGVFADIDVGQGMTSRGSFELFRRLLDKGLPPLIDHIQSHNPLLFDLVLKRCMSYQGFAIANKVFESAAFFRGAASSVSTRS